MVVFPLHISVIPGVRGRGLWATLLVCWPQYVTDLPLLIQLFFSQLFAVTVGPAPLSCPASLWRRCCCPSSHPTYQVLPTYDTGPIPVIGTPATLHSYSSCPSILGALSSSWTVALASHSVYATLFFFFFFIPECFHSTYQVSPTFLRVQTLSLIHI